MLTYLREGAIHNLLVRVAVEGRGFLTSGTVGTCMVGWDPSDSYTLTQFLSLQVADCEVGKGRGLDEETVKVQAGCSSCQTTVGCVCSGV